MSDSLSAYTTSRWSGRALLLCMLVFTIVISPAQKSPISLSPLTNKQSILDGRAFLLFPDNAKIELQQKPGHFPLMDHAALTMINVDVQGMRMMFVAQELFAYAGGDFLTAAKKAEIRYFRHSNFKSLLLVNKDAMAAVLSTPLNMDATKPGVLIQDLLVRTGDQSVFRISVYMEGPFDQQKEQVLQLSENIFKTLVPGNRRLNNTKRTERWPIYNSKKEFLIALPKDYIITRTTKQEFEMLEFHRISELNDTSRASILIYTRRDPAYLYQNWDLNESEAIKTPGIFSGEPVEWLNFKREFPRLYLREQHIKIKKADGENLLVHIAMIYDQPEIPKEFMHIIEAIRITDH